MKFGIHIHGIKLYNGIGYDWLIFAFLKSSIDIIHGLENLSQIDAKSVSQLMDV